MKIDIDDLFGAKVKMNSKPYMIDTEEQAKTLKERIERAITMREITDEKEFETAEEQLGLCGKYPCHIWSFVDGAEFLVCFSEDWYG